MFDNRASQTPAEDGAVLLTGATGFVGMEVMARYLEHGDRKIFALVRAADQPAAQERINDTIEWLFGSREAHAGRVVAIPGDLEEPGLGMSAESRETLAEEVVDVVHIAASVSFELGLAESRVINVEGTRGVLELCKFILRHGRLRGVSYVSTAYVAGYHKGTFGENDLNTGQTWRNAYESSKFEAETLARSYTELPLRVLRPSIIVGDQHTGWTSSFNVIYWPLRAYERNGYVALPARRSAVADVVPVDYVADAIYALTERGGAEGETFHLTASDNAARVGDIIDLAVERFDRPAPRLLPPALYQRIAHPLLLHTSRGARHDKLKRSEVFFPYFVVDVEYDNSKARAALEPLGITAAPFTDYFDKLIDFAQAAEWGRNKLTRADHVNMQRELAIAA